MGTNRSDHFNLDVTYVQSIDEDDAGEKFESKHRVGSNIRMRKHQIALARACLLHEKNQYFDITTLNVINITDMATTIGVIGDKVGAGKSYVVLAIVLDDHDNFTTINSSSMSMNRVSMTSKDIFIDVDINVIVIPHNIIGQWKEYILQFLGENTDLTPYVFHSIRQYNTLSNMFVNATQRPRDGATTDLEKHKLYLVTSTMYNIFSEMVLSNGFRVKRLIFDEADNIKIPSAKETPARFSWFVTASYGNLLYPRGYCVWDEHRTQYVSHASGICHSGFIKKVFADLFDKVHIAFAKSLILRNSDDYVNESFAVPLLNNLIIRCQSPTSVNLLNGIVQRNIINCLNAGDVQTAIEYIDPTQRKSENNIVKILVQSFKTKIANYEVQVHAVESMTFSDPSERVVKVEKIQDKIRELNAKVTCIHERVSGRNTCPICYDRVQNKSVLRCCSNTFCFECIQKWITISSPNKYCPMCKASIGAHDVYVVQDQYSDDSDNACLNTYGMVDQSFGGVDVSFLKENNNKFDNLMLILHRLMEQDDKKKILIFCAYDNTFNTITGMLTTARMRYGVLKGNSRVINRALIDYTDGNFNILLVNPINYGCGMNLEITTDVVMFHKFESESEKQVIGRAHRYGRNNSLNVWYLLHQNELVGSPTNIAY
jgi:hypothetical protein